MSVLPKLLCFFADVLYICRKKLSDYTLVIWFWAGERSVVKFDFDSPPSGDAVNPSAECERQLRPLIAEIVESAVAAGWSADDVLLTLVELSWDMYEQRRGDP